MKLTKDDVGKTFLWVDAVTRSCQLIAFNPADDTEVSIRPESGGRKWVPVSDLRRIPDDAPEGYVGFVNISADLAAYERLQQAVRQFLISVRDHDAVWTQGMSRESFGAMLEVRRALGIEDGESLDG